MHSKSGKQKVNKCATVESVKFRIPGKLWMHKFDGSRWEKIGEQELPVNKPLLITTQYHRDACCSKGQAELLIIKVREDNVGAMVMNPHAEIWRKGKHFFIKDLKSFSGTFVNGVKLKEGEELKLENNDMISLPKDYSDPCFKQWAIEGRPIPESVFKFVAPVDMIINKNTKSSAVRAETTMPEICSMSQSLIDLVIKNPIVLTKIMSFLSLPVLKLARQVCSEWNKECLKQFCALGQFDVPGVSCPHWKTIQEFTEVLPLKNVTLDVNPVPLCIMNGMEDWEPIEDTMWEAEGKKYLDNLTWFFGIYGHNLTTLQLKLKTNSWSIFMRILPNLVHLRSLKLNITSKLNSAEWVAEVKFPNKLELLSVKELDFHCEERDLMIGRGPGISLETKYTQLVLNILLIFPKLEWVKFTGARLTNFNTIFFQTLKRYGNMMPMVNAFSITQGEGPFDGLSQVKELAEVDFMQKLKKLEITNVSVPLRNMRTSATLLFNLVNKHAATLEHLTLGVENPGHFFQSEGYPICSKLKTLKILVGNKALVMDPREPPRLCVDYGVCFPQLETLIFERNKKFLTYKYPLILNDNESFYPFIPRNPETCNTIKRIILPETGRHGADSKYTLFILMLSGGFPNSNKEEERFQLARRGDWHKLKDDGKPNYDIELLDFIFLMAGKGDLDIIQQQDDKMTSLKKAQCAQQ